MPLNMIQIAKKSRKKPMPGDIFAFQMRPDGLFRYGRVIRTDTSLGLHDGKTILVYIYKASSVQKTPVPTLRKDELLLPPRGQNDMGWRYGYFETVEHRPLQEDDLLKVHCFHIPGFKIERYVDADGMILPHRYEPCGLYAIGGYGALDWDVSNALGFPEPTEDEPETASGAAEGGHRAKPKKKRKRRDVEHSVSLHVADPPAGPLAEGFDKFEDQLIEAVERAGVGKWEGHEFGLDGAQAIIYFHGKDADVLADVLLPILRKSDLPTGSYLLKLYGEPGDAAERIDL